MIVVGLAGRAGAGKTTAARLIADAAGLEVMSFAALLKGSAAAALGVGVDELEQVKRDSLYRVALTRDGSPVRELTVREFLQRYGTEAHRDVFGESFWTDALEARLDLEDGRYVVDDVRTVAEAEWIRGLGGRVYAVTNPRQCVATGHLHTTEIPLPGELVHGEIINSGTVEDLAAAVEAIASSWAKAVAA